MKILWNLKLFSPRFLLRLICFCALLGGICDAADFPLFRKQHNSKTSIASVRQAENLSIRRNNKLRQSHPYKPSLNVKPKNTVLTGSTQQIRDAFKVPPGPFAIPLVSAGGNLFYSNKKLQSVSMQRLYGGTLNGPNHDKTFVLKRTFLNKPAYAVAALDRQGRPIHLQGMSSQRVQGSFRGMDFTGGTRLPANPIRPRFPAPGRQQLLITNGP